MELVISGKVIQLLPEQSGEGKNGTWRKREFVLETQDNFPKKICMNQWGDEIDRSNLKVGEVIKASIDINSREYNGRWYTDVKAWKVEKSEANSSTDGFEDQQPQSIPDFSDSDDDLPF